MLSDTVVALFLDLIAMLMLVFGKKKKKARSEHLREQFTQLHSIISGSVL